MAGTYFLLWGDWNPSKVLYQNVSHFCSASYDTTNLMSLKLPISGRDVAARIYPGLSQTLFSAGETLGRVGPADGLLAASALFQPFTYRCAAAYVRRMASSFQGNG